MTLVSIACATHNGGRFLKEQLDSVISQDYPKLVVVCDDGSQDETKPILESYARRCRRFRLVHNDQRIGYIRSFEKAVTLSMGQIIALCDQDELTLAPEAGWVLFAPNGMEVDRMLGNVWREGRKKKAR